MDRTLPREDFIPFFRHPRVDDATVRKFRKALDSAGVGVSSVLPLFRWSGPDEEARQAAVRYWKRAIRITADLGVDSMISELNGRPEDPDRSEAQFWKSMDDLLPLLEQEGIRLTLEPHPDDFIENGHDAINLIRGINHPNVSFLYCAPHTFHIGNDAPGIIKHAERPAHPRPPRRRPGPHRVLRQPLHPQPARYVGPDPSAPRHRPGRGRLRRTLPRAARARIRRHPHGLCLRLGRTRQGILRLHAEEDRRVPGHLVLTDHDRPGTDVPGAGRHSFLANLP